jgi:hypothetical protein
LPSLDNRRVPQEPLSELIESIRSRVQAELDAQLPALAARHEEAIAATRREVEEAAERRNQEMVAAARREAEADAERRIAALTPPPPVPISRTMLEAFSAMDSATGVSDTLRALAAAAAKQGGSLFVGPELDRWPGGAGEQARGPATLVKDSFSAGRVLRRDGTIAAPLLLDGTAIGVLQATASNDADADALELLARYGAARLGALTAARIIQAQRWGARPAAATGNVTRTSERKTETEQSGEDDDVQSARRYARLLVSEIKLYNETAVNEGRAQRDLSRRLAAEIERARRFYEQRVPSTIPDRAQHFHHELIQTLAGGDPTLLG